MDLLHIICTVIFLIQGLKGTDVLFFLPFILEDESPLSFKKSLIK